MCNLGNKNVPFCVKKVRKWKSASPDDYPTGRFSRVVLKDERPTSNAQRPTSNKIKNKNYKAKNQR
jgi:hypothetical protein